MTRKFGGFLQGRKSDQPRNKSIYGSDNIGKTVYEVSDFDIRNMKPTNGENNHIREAFRAILKKKALEDFFISVTVTKMLPFNKPSNTPSKHLID